MTTELSKTTEVPAFPDVKVIGEKIVRLPTYANSVVLLDAMGVECSYDIFHDRRYVGGQLLGSQVGQVTDDVLLLIRKLSREQHGFDPGKDHIWDAVNFKCRVGTFHPIRDYLNKCAESWDFTPRIDTWMTTYLGIADSALTRAMGRLILMASVRRIWQPGVKWDYMPVLVGPENKAKSLAIATLYGEENFSDQKIIGISDKELAEAVRGRWGIESAELAGLRKADIDHLKAQISRQTDRVRPAYGRAVVDVPRQCVLWGTTNDPIFLRHAHGNRRLPPFKVGQIDIERLAADRDLLWGEAVMAEAAHGPTLALPESVYAEVKAAQERHTEFDPWADKLADASAWAASAAEATRASNETRRKVDPNDKPDALPYERHDFIGDNGVERIASAWLLTIALGIPDERLSPALTHRLSTVMQGLGWSEPHQMKIGGRNQRGYERPLSGNGE